MVRLQCAEFGIAYYRGSQLKVRGTVRKLWRAKARAARALADAVPRLLNSGTATVACCAPFQTACRKLIPLSSSAFLRFAAHPEAGIRRRRAKRGHAVQAVRPPSTSSTDAGTLYADVICSRVLAAAADSKGVASLMTGHLLAHHALLVSVGVHSAVHKVCCFGGAVVPPLHSSQYTIRILYCIK